MIYYHNFLLDFLRNLLKLSFFASLLCCAGCGPFKKEVNRDKLKGEYINNKEGEILFTSPPPVVRIPRKYPWTKKEMGGFFKITKDFFRCRGDTTHPLVIKENSDGKKINIRDCVGGEKHGLPVRDGKEFIYPCLIDLLNFIQEKTKKKVVITTGHRCPVHNAYVDGSSTNKSSRHMLGAEVDFYVQGMEKEPEKIISLLQTFYKENPDYNKEPDYTTFQRGDAEKYNITVAPWQNKEILIKLNLEQENRDFDNSHPYPYITIVVRYDRENKTKILFDEKLIYQYLRK